MLLTEDEEERGVRLGKINYFYIFIGANCISFCSIGEIGVIL